MTIWRRVQVQRINTLLTTRAAQRKGQHPDESREGLRMIHGSSSERNKIVLLNALSESERKNM
jgi:hypothetical protein